MTTITDDFLPLDKCSYQEIVDFNASFQYLVFELENEALIHESSIEDTCKLDGNMKTL